MKRAIIESIIDDYHVRIRIPQLHGIKGSENYVATERLPVATICIQPGSEAIYKVGDIVFVAFENDVFTTPIIMGILSRAQS